MRVFDSATEEIKQGGTRRGANMGILSIDHPDIEAFIRCKEDTTKLTNFNISVSLTEEFMRVVEEDREYELINPRTGEVAGALFAKKVFEDIVDAAWRTGEPGIIFIDRMNQDNPTPRQGRIESTNPCGEQPLLPYESCNLGSINLAKMVTDGRVNWDKLSEVAHTSVHFLDNVIDANRYPLELIEKNTKTNRKIGLGVMGWADMLVQLGIPYDSEEAIDLAENVMLFIREEGRKASAALAEERGPFPAFEDSIYDQPSQPPLRNATITTIAPTGTSSIIGGASSGIEPHFAISYTRTCMDDDELAEVNPYFAAVAEEHDFYSEELMMEVAREGSIQKMEEIPQHLKRLFMTTNDISPEWHVKMQAAFQKYTDNAVSKTVNFPESATRDDIAEVYKLAFNLGCKGVTVYRYGSRENQVLTVDKEEMDAREQPGLGKRGTVQPRPRPETVMGVTRKVITGCGSLYVTINEDSEGMFEVFTNMGKSGGCAASQAEAVSRLISMALRSGVKTEEIVRQLMGISCPKMTWWQGKKVLSCADALAKALEIYPAYGQNGSKKVEEIEPAGTIDGRFEFVEPEAETSGFMEIITCPECKSTVEKSETCVKCHYCGWTEC
jgi:ribonucleoside-diphosphate reductase alpha chain